MKAQWEKKIFIKTKKYAIYEFINISNIFNGMTIYSLYNNAGELIEQNMNVNILKAKSSILQ